MYVETRTSLSYDEEEQMHSEVQHRYLVDE
jgi:hypothetical protein